MKKTVLYEEIDGHKIITGFDRPTVDGVETSKIINGHGKEPGLIHDTPEYQAVEAKKAEYQAAINELSELRGKYKKGANVPREAQEQWNHALGKMSVRQDELKPLARDLADKITALRRSHAVYFTPRAGEVIKAGDEVDGLVRAIKGRSGGELIAIDGSTVEDNRGTVYFRKSGGKWGRTEICKLGDKIPSDAVTEPTESQAAEIEVDRVAALPADIRAKEKERAMDSALKSAAAMRNELEIKSDPDALTKSQDWYQTEVDRIEGLYG